jgi:WD40 repeat protein
MISRIGLIVLCGLVGSLGWGAGARAGLLRFTVAQGTIVNLAWSPDGQSLAYCGFGDAVGNHAGCAVINAASGKVETIFPQTDDAIAGNGNGVLAFASADRLLLPARWHSHTGFVTLWDVATGRAAGGINLAAAAGEGSQTASQLSLAASRASFAATQGGAHKVRIYALPGLRLVRAIAPRRGQGVMNISLAADGRFLAVRLSARRITVFNVASGATVGTIGFDRNRDTAPASALAMSPNDRYLAVGFENGGVVQVPGGDGKLETLPNPWPMRPILVWPLIGGVGAGPPKALCGPQTQGVLNMVWTPDSHALIFTDNRGTVVSCPVSGAAGTILLHRRGNAVQIPAISPDGRRLAVGAGDQIVIIALKR